MRYSYKLINIALAFFCACNKENDNPTVQPLVLAGITIQNSPFNDAVIGQPIQPSIKLKFTEAIKPATISGSVSIKDEAGNSIPLQTVTLNGDEEIVIKPGTNLSYLSKYNFAVSRSLQSASGGNLQSPIDLVFVTQLDSSRKFPALSDNELLTKVQQQTFKYFWDFAHPTSGLAREGSKHPANTVTSGGSGFGIMALIVGIERGFITKTQGLQRLQTIVSFLKNTAQTFHGAYPHWLDGASGSVIPFSSNDNGADLVETSYLVQGLLTARQYFNGAGTDESVLRSDINTIVNRVEWNWFQQNGQDVLYWHWSPDKAWTINLKIQGWNECLITYVLAASSTDHSTPKTAYDAGWARSGALKNGKQFYGITLPLGQDLGGPLFFSHYSFLGLKPVTLSDAYASYNDQTKSHTRINYEYCKDNPKNFYGYSDSVWGLTASNIKGGYNASSPANDLGYIAPTAALSSMPYTPDESMAALKFYYYVLGDKIFKEYGFTDAFTLDVLKNGAWFDDRFLAIDQGPIIVMIENYRTGLIWDLFMSCPEVAAGLQKLGFSGF